MSNDLKVPLYLTIANSIIDKIQKRELKPGSQVPSENEIIRAHRVSNTTARKVLQEIEHGGWAVKVRGKGTFVSDFVVERAATKVLSFTKNMIDQGLIPSTKIIHQEVLDKDVSLMVSGKKYKIVRPVFKLQRLRYANEVPMMFETRYISLQYCPGITEYDMKRSLYDIYLQEYHLNIMKIEQDISAIFLDLTSNAYFDVKRAIPGIKVEGVTFSGKDKVVEGEESIYRGDKYKFSVQAVP